MAERNLEVELDRDIDAIVIPHGHHTRLPKGSRLRVLQTLGESATVTAEFGGLFRVDAEHFDALGLEAPKSAEPGIADSSPLEDRVWGAMRTCYDPEIPVNIVELGLIYDCRIGESENGGRRDVRVKMTLTAPGCGMGDVIAEDVRHKLEKLPEVGRAEVEVVFDPPWNQDMMSEAAKLQLGFF